MFRTAVMWNKELESGDAIVFNYPAEGFLGAMRAQSSKLKPIHHSFFEKCQNKEWERVMQSFQEFG